MVQDESIGLSFFCSSTGEVPGWTTTAGGNVIDVECSLELDRVDNLDIPKSGVELLRVALTNAEVKAGFLEEKIRVDVVTERMRVRNVAILSSLILFHLP